MLAHPLWAELSGWTVTIASGGLFILGIGALLWFLTSRRREPSTPLPSNRINPVSPTEGPGPGVDKDRRVADRSWGNPVGILYIEGTARVDPSEGWVLNRSGGGLCLSLGQPVPIGSTLKVRVSTMPETVPWVQAEVRFCSPYANRWKVGCHFVQPPTEEVLLLFG